MRAQRAVAAAAVAGLLGAAAACGGDDSSGAGTTGASGSTITVSVADDTSPIVRLRDITCAREDDTGLVATGIVDSSGDDTHYVSVTVRFVDADGVRVELASDTVSELLVGESARWDAMTYADGAGEVERCEVTATVS